MNIFTPSWLSLFTVLAIVLPIIGGISGGVAYYIDKNLPIKYKIASEIDSQLDIFIKPSDNNALDKASEYFKTVPLDHLTDEHKKKINEILLDNIGRRMTHYYSLIDLAYKIYSPENDTLFKAIIKNDNSDPKVVQMHAFQYCLGRETDELNPQLISLIHHPKYTSPQTANFKLIAFLSKSLHLSDISDSAAVTLANNKEVIDELINVQNDWFEKYDEYRIVNLNNGDHALDIDEIIRGTYLAQEIEEIRNQIRASEKNRKQ